jgi:hypothetical protein
MKTIKLQCGAQVTLDDVDVERFGLMPWKVDKSGHVAWNTWIDGRPKTLLLHREIFGAKPGQLLDHKNRDKLDNRRENIRLADARGNAANRDPQRTNKRHSRYKGVTFHGQRKRWQAACGKRYLGLFASEESAALAYDRAAREAFGEFARPNFGTDGWVQESAS